MKNQNQKVNQKVSYVKSYKSWEGVYIVQSLRACEAMKGFKERSAMIWVVS